MRIAWRRGPSAKRDRATLPPNRKRPSKKTSKARGKGAGRNPEGPSRGAGRVLAVLRLVATVAVVGLAVLGGVLAYRHATTSDHFAVDDFDVSGNKRLPEEDVLEAAGIEPGLNVFAVDPAEIRARLEAHPWIAEASAKREIPRSVAFEVVERRVEATIVFEVPYLLDDSGVVFKRWAPGDPAPAPMLTGFARDLIGEDDEGDASDVRDAVALVRRYRAAGLERIAPLSEVHLEVDGGLSLTVGDDPFYVRLGRGPYRKKLARLATLLGRMGRDGERPAVVFFDNEIRPDRVTVKTKPAPATDEGDQSAAKEASKPEKVVKNLINADPT